MALYEHVFLARPDVSAQQVEALTEQFKTVIEQNGGTVAKSEYWGVKSLTFRMKKTRKAHYSLLNLDAPSAAVVEMERQMRINEDILRFLTVRVEEHEEGQSAMLARRGERDDRGGRGGRDDRFGRREERFGGGGGGGGRDDRPPRGDDRPPRRPRDERSQDDAA